MNRFLRAVVVAALVLTPDTRLSAAESSGRAAVSGVVRDNTGAALPGVTVTLTRSGGSAAPSIAVTGMSGEFAAANLAPGAYTLNVSLDGFNPLSKKVTLVTGQKIDIAFSIAPAFAETVEVVADAARTGEVAILESRRQSPVVSDSISAEEIKRSPDSSAASVVERLTGVTLLGDKYVFVRGLGERYSGTTINGATIATTETEKRVVPLDLFPAKLLETVNIVKTYTPDKPGDFGSGVVEMNTVEFPSSPTLRLSLGAGYYSGTTGRDFGRYAGGLSRWGNGGQAMSTKIPEGFVRRSSILNSTGFTANEMESFGESIVGSWTGDRSQPASPGTDFSLTYGDTFGRLGLVFSAVSYHRMDSTEEQLRFFGLDAEDILVPRNDYVLLTNRETANTGLVGNLSYRITDNNRVFWNSVLTRDASSEDRFQEGLNTNSGGDVRDYRVRYQIEQILSSRLRGEHNVAGPGIGSLIEWNAGRSAATNDSDLRENLYRELDEGVFALNTGAAETGCIDFFNLDDSIKQGGAAYTLFYATASGLASGSVKVGADYLERTRDFDARRFRFNPVGSLAGVDLTGTPDEIFTSQTIGPNGFELREATGVNDAYDAEQTVAAGFFMADATMGRWRFIGGARYEDSEQLVTTFNPFDTANVVPSVNEGRDLLPSINVVFQASPRTNIRAAYGRSLNRPEFRELSPFAFTEVTGGRSVIGNPALRQATLDGFDLRWERFPAGGEVIAASVFYKKIDKPIERVVQPTTELRTSFVNADEASLWGAELEFRRSLGMFTSALANFSVNLNYSYIHSEVTIGAQDLSVITNEERPLEGQSDQVANVALQYLHPRAGTMVRLLTSYVGERIADVGAYGLPDIYENGYASVDAVISQSLGRWARGLEVKLGASNLLNADREFTQGDSLQRLYRPGRSINLSFSLSPF